MKRLVATMLAILALSGPGVADELPVAWSDESPVAWAPKAPTKAPAKPPRALDAPSSAVQRGPALSPRVPALDAIPPITFDLSALDVATNAAPVVAVPQPFRGIERRESHNCPRCGALVLAKAGRGPEPGTHLHRCPYDGALWFHDDK